MQNKFYTSLFCCSTYLWFPAAVHFSGLLHDVPFFSCLPVPPWSLSLPFCHCCHHTFITATWQLTSVTLPNCHLHYPVKLHVTVCTHSIVIVLPHSCGLLCVHLPQKVKCWKTLFSFLDMRILCVCTCMCVTKQSAFFCNQIWKCLVFMVHVQLTVLSYTRRAQPL